MGYAIQLDITNDTATPAVRAARAMLQPARLNPIIGRAAVNAYRAHLFGLNQSRPNRLGGPRTNFYATAARGTHFDILNDDTVVISINQVGIAARFYGGTIKPKTAKFLTIPIAPEAHGHRAREFDLEVVFGEGGRPVALATKSTRAVQFTQDKRGKIVRKLIGRHGVIMFLLVKSVTQQPDPTVLPYSELVLDKINGAVQSTLDRELARAQQRNGNGPAGGAN